MENIYNTKYLDKSFLSYSKYHVTINDEFNSLDNLQQQVTKQIINNCNDNLYSKLNPISYLHINKIYDYFNSEKFTHIFIPFDQYDRYLKIKSNINYMYNEYEPIIVLVNSDNCSKIYLWNSKIQFAEIKQYNEIKDNSIIIHYSMIINNPNVVELILQ